MAKKPKATSVDFNFGIGRIIPATQESFKSGYDGAARKAEKGELADFKDVVSKQVEGALKGISQFPTKSEVFVFIIQYFAGEKEYLKRDVDNMAKTILDVLKDRLYFDDSQVKTLLAGKKMEKRVSQDFAYIAVKEIKDGREVDAMTISGMERSITLFQELKSQGLLK